MKNILLPLVAILLLGCSKDDDGPKCESCISQAGNTFRICENSNESYTLTGGGESRTITKEEMEDQTPTSVVEAECATDLPL